MKNLHWYVILTVLSVTFLTGCGGDEDQAIPGLVIRNDSDYTCDGSFLKNHVAKLGIIADGNGANITNLVIKIKKNNTEYTILDEGYNSAVLNITKTLQISRGDSLDWTIIVMNRDRKTASVTFFTRDTTKSFREILTFPDIRMGMQNSAEGPFLDPFTGLVYRPSNVSGHENDIHVLGYYYISSGTPSYTFSSPGDQDASSYIPSLSGWSNFNYTDWDYVTVVSEAAFDAAVNDSLLVASFHSGAGISSRKYKWATPGKVIPFKTVNSKIGLIKVKSVGNTDSGYINFDLKIQK